jgi:hypothetical protein
MYHLQVLIFISHFPSPFVCKIFPFVDFFHSLELNLRFLSSFNLLLQKKFFLFSMSFGEGSTPVKLASPCMDLIRISTIVFSLFDS